MGIQLKLFSVKTSKKASTKSAKPKIASKRITSYPRSAGDVFVTQKMLYSVRDELVAHTEKKFQQTEVNFHEVKAEIQDVRSEIHEVRSEIHEVKAAVHEVKAQVAQLEKTVNRVALLVEEQNNRNKIVLDGLSQLFERQDRIEKKVDSSF